MKTANKKKILKMLKTRPRMRYWLCRKSVYWFGLYYFSHYFFCKGAPFHKEMAEDLSFKDHKFLMWIMFRESAKTVWGKIKVIHAIVYEYKRNIAWVAHDQKKAEKQIMSISSELKGNKKIIADFGQLYFEDISLKKKKSKVKTFSEFMTTNNVNVKATSTQISTRGELQDQYRPDLYIIDDIENMKTARSLVITKNVIEYMEELFGGMAVDCDVLILANRIARNGSVSKIEKMLDENPEAIIHEVKIYDEDGKIRWPARFVETIVEAKKQNKGVLNKKRHVKSLEQMRHDLGTSGFNREMLLEPLDTAGAPIRMEWIRREAMPELDSMNLCVSVDPAISQKQTADYFAMAAGGRHRKTGKIHVFRSYKTRCGVVEQVNLIVNWHKLYPKAKFRIETVAYQQALSQLIAAERKNKYYIPVEECKPTIDKLLRASAIAPFIERGDVVFSNSPEMDSLIENLCAFPFVEHDDDVDTLISLIEHFVHKTLEPSLMVG